MRCACSTEPERRTRGLFAFIVKHGRQVHETRGDAGFHLRDNSIMSSIPPAPRGRSYYELTKPSKNLCTKIPSYVVHAVAQRKMTPHTILYKVRPKSEYDIMYSLIMLTILYAWTTFSIVLCYKKGKGLSSHIDRAGLSDRKSLSQKRQRKDASNVTNPEDTGAERVSGEGGDAIDFLCELQVYERSKLRRERIGQLVKKL